MDRFWDWAMLILVVAGLFLFVRPNSKGPDIINGVTSGMVNLVNAATGGGGWSGNK